jgi:PTS system nitrogen regulatory IIA component
MNLISKILLPDNILLDNESTSKKRVFERVGLLFENNQQIARSQVFDSLFAWGKVVRSLMDESQSCAKRLPRLS